MVDSLSDEASLGCCLPEMMILMGLSWLAATERREGGTEEEGNEQWR